MNNEEMLQFLNNGSKNTFMEHMGIVYTEFTGDSITAEMEVKTSSHQPMGFLHGGVSLALAETVGSALSMTSVNSNEFFVFGTQVNGYHIKSVKSGKIKAIASFINKGNTSQVIEINIYNEHMGEVVKNCYVTMINRIVPKKNFQ